MKVPYIIYFVFSSMELHSATSLTSFIFRVHTFIRSVARLVVVKTLIKIASYLDEDFYQHHAIKND